MSGGLLNYGQQYRPGADRRSGIEQLRGLLGAGGDVYGGAARAAGDYARENPLETASLLLSSVPVVGDALGLASDVKMYATEPESRTVGNMALSALGALPFVPHMPHIAGMFAGPNAMNAPLDKWVAAKKMDAEGAKRDDIWNETGWFKGPDGRWRWEIDDSGAKLDMDSSGSSAPLKNVLSHPGGLFEAYPQLANMPVSRESSGDFYGSYSPSQKKFTTGGGVVGGDPTSTLLHEIQHAIQEIEDFGRGGMPSGSTVTKALGYLPDKGILDEATSLQWLIEDYGGLKQAMEKYPTNSKGQPWNDAAIHLAQQDPMEIKNQYSKLQLAEDPNEVYRRLAGETEARLTQKRRNLPGDIRPLTPPYKEYDVGEKGQIVYGMQRPSGMGSRR